MRFASPSLPFSACTEFSLGVEEELLMAAPVSFRPWGGTDAVLALMEPDVGAITGEVTDGVLGLVTPICHSAAGAITVLERLRAHAGRTVQLLGAGIPPTARFGDVRLRAGD